MSEGPGSPLFYPNERYVLIVEYRLHAGSPTQVISGPSRSSLAAHQQLDLTKRIDLLDGCPLFIRITVVQRSSTVVSNLSTPRLPG